MKIRSRYKYFGGVGIILGINIYVASKLWTIFPKANIDPFTLESWQNEAVRIAMLVFFAIHGLLIWLFISQCKIIIISNEGITFINPVLPFIRTTRIWSDYDYFQTVQERSMWAGAEALWLIKDNILKERISCFYYTNYSEIKDGIKTENRGELSISEYRQLLSLWGFKIKKRD